MSPFVLLNTEDADLDICIDVDGYAITVEIAEDEETGRSLFVDCLLKRRQGVLQEGYPTTEFWEFAFQVILTDPWNARDPLETMDRFIVRGWLPPDGSSVVMAIAERCLCRFIEKFDPPTIYRVTASPDLPEKALAKHRRLTMQAERYGYVVAYEGLDAEGRYFWIMK